MSIVFFGRRGEKVCSGRRGLIIARLAWSVGRHASGRSKLKECNVDSKYADDERKGYTGKRETRSEKWSGNNSHNRAKRRRNNQSQGSDARDSHFHIHTYANRRKKKKTNIQIHLGGHTTYPVFAFNPDFEDTSQPTPHLLTDELAVWSSSCLAGTPMSHRCQKNCIRRVKCSIVACIRSRRAWRTIRNGNVAIT